MYIYYLKNLILQNKIEKVLTNYIHIYDNLLNTQTEICYKSLCPYRAKVIEGFSPLLNFLCCQIAFEYTVSEMRKLYMYLGQKF